LRAAADELGNFLALRAFADQKRLDGLHVAIHRGVDPVAKLTRTKAGRRNALLTKTTSVSIRYEITLVYYDEHAQSPESRFEAALSNRLTSPLKFRKSLGSTEY
jgi:hypothetical protein